MKKNKIIESNILEMINEIDVYNIKRFIAPYNTKHKSYYMSFFNNPDNYFPIFISIKKMQLEYLDDSIFKANSNFCFNIKLKNVTKLIYLILTYSLLLTIYQMGEVNDGGRFNISKNNNKPFFNYSEEVLNVQELKAIMNNKNKKYYRGHSNCDWTLIPSIVRNLNKNVVLNENYIVNKLYAGINRLTYKYKKHIGYSIPYNIYELYAFIQHSVSYSTLIDLTSNPLIATSFSLFNSDSKNDFCLQKSAVLELEINDFLLKKYNVLYDKTNISQILEKCKYNLLKRNNFIFGKAEEVDEYNGNNINKKMIRFDTFQDIVQHFIPMCYIFDYPVNDRMKYQKGSFIYFYGDDFVIFNNDFLYEFTYGLKIKKYIIECSDKNSLLSYINSFYREYDKDHLMNPYKIFSE